MAGYNFTNYLINNFNFEALMDHNIHKKLIQILNMATKKFLNFEEFIVRTSFIINIKPNYLLVTFRSFVVQNSKANFKHFSQIPFMPKL